MDYIRSLVVVSRKSIVKRLFYLSLFIFLGLASMSNPSSLYAQQPVVTDGWSSDSNCSVNGGNAGVNCYIANPPSLTGDDNGIIEANAFENVYEYGDVLVVMRFRLSIKDLPLLNNPNNTPTSWGSTWCDFLADNTNCHISPPAPTYAQTISNAAGITTTGSRVNDYGKNPLVLGYCKDTRTSGSWNNCYDSALTNPLDPLKLQEVYVPRVGYGLVSLYSSSQGGGTGIMFGEQAGNFITGLSEAGRVCLYPNKSVWSSVSSADASCQVVSWVSENNPPLSATDPLVHTKFREKIIDMTKELEKDLDIGTNRIVTTNQKVTVLGSTFIAEGVPRANEVLSPIYEIGVNKAITETHVNSSALPLQTDINTDYANSSLKTSFDSVGQFNLGFQGTNTGLWVIVMLVVLVALSFAFTYVQGMGAGGGRMVLVLGTTPLFVFMFAGFPSVAFVFTFVAVLSIFGAYYIFSRAG